MKVLFISDENPARFLVDMLLKQGIDTKLVPTTADISSEAASYNPTHVFLEMWVDHVVFGELQQSYPAVKWIVRGHHEVPVLAQEKMGISRIIKYVQYKNVAFAVNSESAVRDIRAIIKAANPDWSYAKVCEKVLYLPDYYPYRLRNLGHETKDSKILNVACFGAINPLKNQFIQAVAAIKYAELERKTLHFHITAAGVDDTIQRNLEALFKATSHSLVKHSWMSHEKFLALLRQMDIAMQVSFSETFNIVAADCVVTGLPIVVSPKVSWASSWCQAEPTDSEDILLKLIKADDWRLKLAMKVLNLRGLRHFCEASHTRWVKYLSE